MLLLAVQWGGVTYPWGSATVIGLLCGAAGAIVLFLVVEKFRGDTAMIPLAMLRMRVFSCAGVTTFISGGSNLLIAYYLPIWFQVVKNNSPTMGGVHYLPTIGAQIFATVSAGALGKTFTSNSIFNCPLTGAP
jgi:hypothetical protein